MQSPDNLESALRANSDFVYENTAFEAIVVSASERENQFVVGLRSLKNGKLLSCKNKELFASAHNLSDNEKFHIYYSFNNVIGLLINYKLN